MIGTVNRNKNKKDKSLLEPPSRVESVKGWGLSVEKSFCRPDKHLTKRYIYISYKYIFKANQNLKIDGQHLKYGINERYKTN